jgi:hypothetical protein
MCHDMHRSFNDLKICLIPVIVFLIQFSDPQDDECDSDPDIESYTIWAPQKDQRPVNLPNGVRAGQKIKFLARDGQIKRREKFKEIRAAKRAENPQLPRLPDVMPKGPFDPPSPILLNLHAALVKVRHARGAAESLDDTFDDGDLDVGLKHEGNQQNLGFLDDRLWQWVLASIANDPPDQGML